MKIKKVVTYFVLILLSLLIMLSSYFYYLVKQVNDYKEISPYFAKNEVLKKELKKRLEHELNKKKD